jgi:hypothetical protein
LHKLVNKYASKYNGKRGYVVLNDVRRMIFVKGRFFHEATIFHEKDKHI